MARSPTPSRPARVPPWTRTGRGTAGRRLWGSRTGIRSSRTKDTDTPRPPRRRPTGRILACPASSPCPGTTGATDRPTCPSTTPPPGPGGTTWTPRRRRTRASWTTSWRDCCRTTPSSPRRRCTSASPPPPGTTSATPRRPGGASSWGRPGLWSTGTPRRPNPNPRSTTRTTTGPTGTGSATSARWAIGSTSPRRRGCRPPWYTSGRYR
mmetsp:Transcript_23797/g.56363  ORF Transcript_23797/g.56363 Transcript_23797/m.56363 type:complete len:209 (-) Transcript_23797:77-703(-)